MFKNQSYFFSMHYFFICFCPFFYLVAHLIELWELIISMVKMGNHHKGFKDFFQDYLASYQQ